jgi:hypothetical protein
MAMPSIRMALTLIHENPPKHLFKSQIAGG